MPSATVILIIAAVAVGCLPPVQAGVNATIAGYHGHPLWGALTNTLVASITLATMIGVLGVPAADARALAAAPLWSWLGGIMGAAMVLSGIILAPRLGAAGYVSAMVVGTVTASLVIDHFGLVGFAEHPATALRLCGGMLVIVGMILVQTN